MILDRTAEAIIQIRKISQDQLVAFTDMMVQVSKEECPYQTGNLRRSIGAEYGPLDTRIFTRTGYGGWVHNGTARMPARPFFAWAFEKVKNDFTGET